MDLSLLFEFLNFLSDFLAKINIPPPKSTKSSKCAVRACWRPVDIRHLLFRHSFSPFQLFKKKKGGVPPAKTRQDGPGVCTTQ
jgi:hypothetical protein